MSNPSGTPIENLAINTIRTLSMDAVQAAESGHPGSPMGIAPIAYVLWQRFLSYDPSDPTWFNRDRFVLSAGHASMLLYSVLHVTQTKSVGANYEILDTPAVPLEDIKRFRQLDSKCPGHPEYRWTSGVETTTGPLGQGIANSVGMAIAAKWTAANYNRPGFDLFNHDVYAICGDGCLMEGISTEAASLAGHLKLSNLCWVYDSNRITIEGGTDLAFTEDVATRFTGYGWNVLHVADANNLSQLDDAFTQFQNKTSERPTLIIVKSHIAFGSPNKQDTCGAHGEPLGEEEIRLTKRSYGWPEDAKFLVPDGVYDHFADGIGKRGREEHQAWNARFAQYKQEFPALADNLERMQRRELPEGWDKNLPVFAPDAKGKATRDTSGQVLNAIAQNVPWLIGGSADLAPSNKTRLTFAGAGDMQTSSFAGRNMHFGVREHAMGAILNGMSVSKVRPYGGTFLVFSDYVRPAVRLSALMEIPVIYVFTHDSIGVGEDGPTHQPVEHLATLRAIPGLQVIRPADANETSQAIVAALEYDGPTALILSRQNLPVCTDGSAVSAGAGVVREAAGASVTLVATGSEVSLALEAADALGGRGVTARVVSMPSWDRFAACPQAQREAILPTGTPVVSIEAASTFGWERWADACIGIDRFGASAPGPEVLTRLGMNVDHVMSTVTTLLQGA